MLHLAQVQKNPTTGEMMLQLLAEQTPEDFWAVGDAEAIALTPQIQAEIPYLSEGVLVLVNLGENRQILALENARDWLLLLLQRLQDGKQTEGEGFSLEEEEARIEQWRQELTLQSQEIARRNLEIETRREQIQELEASLEKEKMQLELRWQELKNDEL